MFRIECEYANGAVRWVVYRELREFLSLHGHYTISNAYNRNIENLPEFPLTCGYMRQSRIIIVLTVLQLCPTSSS